MIDATKNRSRAAILDTIRRSKRIARIDLAHATDISAATVTTITADMIRHGLIEEVAPEEGKNPSRRGRPRVDLKLRADAFLVAGLKLADETISVVLMDFEGTVVLQRKQQRDQAAIDADGLVAQIRQALDASLEGTAHKMSDLSAVGIGIPGIVDAKRGFVHWSPLLSSKNLELGPALRDALQVPVFLDNDANLVAMAEQYLGGAQRGCDRAKHRQPFQPDLRHGPVQSGEPV